MGHGFNSKLLVYLPRLPFAVLKKRWWRSAKAQRDLVDLPSQHGKNPRHHGNITWMTTKYES